MTHFLIYAFPLDKVIHLLRPKVFPFGIIIFTLLKDYSVFQTLPKEERIFIKFLFLFTIKFLDYGVRKKMKNRLGEGKGCIFSIATNLHYKVRVIIFLSPEDMVFINFREKETSVGPTT